MRILLTTACYPPTINGVAIHTQLLYQELTHQGHKVKVFAPDHPDRPPHPDIITYKSVPNPRVPDYPIGVTLRLPKELITFQPDIIHTQHPLAIGYASQRLASKLSAPLFFTHHTRYHDYIDSFLPTGKKLAKKIYDTHFYRFLKSCSSIICPSKDLVEKYQSITPTVHIPNGIDNQLFEPHPKPINIPHFIYVGRLEPVKGVQKLTQLIYHLFQDNDHSRLTIVGEGSLTPTIEKFIQENGFSQQITLTGKLDRHQLPALFHQQSIFVTYSTSEVMPLSYLEAQSCGLPIAHPQEAHLDSIHPNSAIPIPDDYSKASQILLQTISQPKKLQQLHYNAIKNASKYSIQTTTLKHLQLYEKHLQ